MTTSAPGRTVVAECFRARGGNRHSRAAMTDVTVGVDRGAIKCSWQAALPCAVAGTTSNKIEHRLQPPAMEYVANPPERELFANVGRGRRTIAPSFVQVVKGTQRAR